MMNYVNIVGRLKKIEEARTENGRRYTIITVSTPRTFKNINGVYDYDNIKCKCFGDIGENVKYCHINDMIAVKGRLQVKDDKLEAIAEKVTFLAVKGSNE